MSETKEPYKTYWAYQGYPCEFVEIGINELSGCKIMKNIIPPQISLTLHTYLFDTQDEAFSYAEQNGAFEECIGKEHWCETYDEILFEICESELGDYAPIKFIKEKAA